MKRREYKKRFRRDSKKETPPYTPPPIPGCLTDCGDCPASVYMDMPVIEEEWAEGCEGLYQWDRVLETCVYDDVTPQCLYSSIQCGIDHWEFFTHGGMCVYDMAAFFTCPTGTYNRKDGESQPECPATLLVYS